MFIDEATITVKGGNGGAGIVSFFPFKQGPDGGNGGKGGDVYAKVNTNLTTLNKYIEKNVFKGENGAHGESHRRQGKDGGDIYLDLPLGTTIKDVATGDEVELTQPDQYVLIAHGGNGGKGNDAFKSSTNQVPQKAEPGHPGQERQLRLILKLIADYGFIGLPNAGKSSLLNELTAANVKTANYPFTTLEPNLGVVNGKVLADIPGLIEGASVGKGLGIKFLKHIEKVKMLLHCISVESPDIAGDYKVVTEELQKYNPRLLEKQTVILLTKVDMISPEEARKKVKEAEKLNLKVLPVSIHDWDSLEQLKKLLK